MADKCIRQQWFSPKALSVIFPILQPTFPTRCLIDHTEPLLLCYYSAMHWIGFISRITMALWPYVPISTAPIKQKAAIDVHLISHVPCRLWASMVLSLMEPVSLWILRQGIHKTRKKKHTHTMKQDTMEPWQLNWDSVLKFLPDGSCSGGTQPQFCPSPWNSIICWVFFKNLRS